jgi:hypothetical protein
MPCPRGAGGNDRSLHQTCTDSDYLAGNYQPREQEYSAHLTLDASRPYWSLKVMVRTESNLPLKTTGTVIISGESCTHLAL